MFEKYWTLTELAFFFSQLTTVNFDATLVFSQLTIVQFVATLAVLLLVGGSIAMTALVLKSQNEKAGKFSSIHVSNIFKTGPNCQCQPVFFY